METARKDDQAYIPLALQNLDKLSNAVQVFSYDRGKLKAGIVHFGVGNFHRAHQALYLNELFEKGKDHEWGILGAGVLPSEQSHYEALRDQDFLSTIIEQSAETSNATVIGSMIDYITPADTKRTIDVITEPEIRIVSLTITEGGYFLTESGDFDVDHPTIKKDAKYRDKPRTVFGILIKALSIRREAGVPPFTIMSCDNIPHNGNVARNAVVGLAHLIDSSLGEWIKDKVAFPNSMVDRITPVTGERERSLVRKDYGIADTVPVFCEDFRQWVLEDNFPSGRPSLEDVGVQFVKDVTPYEIMKIRILNGGHASIGYPAGLMDLKYVHEAMEHPLINALLTKLEKEEILQAVPEVPGVDLNDYLDRIVQRFSNPKIGDTVKRLCFDGSNRQPKFIVPTIKVNRERSSKVTGLALVSALWCKYCYGSSDSRETFEPNDPSWSELTKTAKAASKEPVIWLQQQSIYGHLSQDTMFASVFSSWLRKLHSMGTVAVLKLYLSSEEQPA